MNSLQLMLKLQEESQLFNRVKSSLLLPHLGNADQIKLAAGDVLLRPERENNSLYIVLSGRLRAQLNLDDPTPLALFGLGECVGEMSMFNDGQVSAYVVAVTDCELLAIPHAEVWAIFNESLQASHNMLTILAGRMRMSNRMLAQNVEHVDGYDALDYINTTTGIYNRRWLSENIVRLVHRHTINQEPCAFVLLQTRDFQQYGARFGALGSDQAQRTIAQTMLRSLRPNDVAVQLGEDRFAVFLPHTRMEDTGAVISRIRAEVSEAAIVTTSGDALPQVSLSAGACAVRAEDTLDDLIERAQGALQKA